MLLADFEKEYALSLGERSDVTPRGVKRMVRDLPTTSAVLSYESSLIVPGQRMDSLGVV